MGGGSPEEEIQLSGASKEEKNRVYEQFVMNFFVFFLNVCINDFCSWRKKAKRENKRNLENKLTFRGMHFRI